MHESLQFSMESLIYKVNFSAFSGPADTRMNMKPWGKHALMHNQSKPGKEMIETSFLNTGKQISKNQQPATKEYVKWLLFSDLYT